MKNIIKKFSILIVIVLSFLFTCTINTYALTNQISQVRIDDIQNLEIGNLSFSNIKFRDYSSTSTQAFGITGEVVNSSNDKISYTSTVYYYDKDYNLIAQGNNLGTANSGRNSFNQMSNLDILKGHSVSEISYYSMLINITNILESSNITPSKISKYSSYDYVIDNYDINIVVNENNTFDITEKITANFNVPKHGIIRTIPLRNTIKRLDGTTSTNRTQITNVSVDNEYITSRENGNYKLRIGSENNTITGKQDYVIKYTYNLGRDHIKDYDELYYNIIGNEWDTVIGNITFSITMPKDFDSSKLGFSSGVKGSTNNSNVRYNVNNNKITGSYNDILGVGEALTIRLELPEGYFVDTRIMSNILIYVMYIIPILGLIVTFILWYKYGRDDKVIETVEFYPPEGFNSLEVGFLYKGEADDRDVTSLLIYLANKGYIRISEIEGKSTKEFKITKLKDYDGNNVNEQNLLHYLFLKTRTGFFDYYSVETVSSADLEDSCLCEANNKILWKINNKENKSKVFEKNTLRNSKISALLIIVSLLILIVIPTLEYGDEIGFFATLFICIFYIPLLFGLSFTIIPGTSISFNRILIVLFAHFAFFGLLFFAFSLLNTTFPFFNTTLPLVEAITNDNIYLFGFIIGILCITGMIVFFRLIPKRTKYGNEMLGKIRGFKKFLETAEKEKLEALVMQEPTYFYDILPYTYVLGVSDKWIKKFESISLQAPSWCDSLNTFDIASFGSFMNSTMESAQSIMSSSDSGGDSSGGGSSGGGSSGGGSGGGGGSSW